MLARARMQAEQREHGDLSGERDANTDTAVKIPVIAMCSPALACRPNSGNTAT